MKPTLIVSLLLSVVAWAQSGLELYQRAVTQERAGKMKEAVALYEKVAHDFASDRPLAAKALVQAARGYEKLGQDGATKVYERIAREFRDQPDALQTAQVKLAALRQPQVPTMTLRRIEFGDSMKAIIATDGVHAVYWDESGSTLLYGDVAGKEQRTVIKVNPTRQPRVDVSPDLSTALLFFPSAGTTIANWALVKTDGSGFRELPSLGTAAALGIGWSWDNRFVAMSRGSKLLKFSLATGEVTDLQSGTAAGEARFSPDGRFIAIGTIFQGPVSVIPAQGGEPNVIANGFLLDWSRDGKYLMIGQVDRGVVLQPVQNGRAAGESIPLRSSSLPSFGVPITLPGGGLLVRSGGGAATEVSIGKLDENDRLASWKRLDLLGNGPFPYWSPDGRQLVYVSQSERGPQNAQSAVRIYNVGTGDDRELYRTNGLLLLCVWASHQPKVFCGQAAGQNNTNVIAISTETGRGEAVATLDGLRVFHYVSPDGQSIVMTRTPGRDGTRTFQWDTATGKETPLRGISSPDGRWALGFVTDAEKRRKLVFGPSASVEGWKDGAYLAGAGGVVGFGPVPFEFTSDSKWVVFRNLDEQGRSGLYRVSTSGGQPERLGPYPTRESGSVLSLSQDGRQFAVMHSGPVRPPEFWILENFLPRAAR